MLSTKKSLHHTFIGMYKHIYIYIYIQVYRIIYVFTQTCEDRATRVLTKPSNKAQNFAIKERFIVLSFHHCI